MVQRYDMWHPNSLWQISRSGWVKRLKKRMNFLTVRTIPIAQDNPDSTEDNNVKERIK